MLTWAELRRKWALYALAAVLCAVLQKIFLQRMTIWGVIPFLYPLLAVIPATYENPPAGGGFAMGVGLVCDWILPGGIPCFYTLLFPFAGYTASMFSKLVLPAGILCSLVVSLWVFAVHGLFHCLALWAVGKAAWTPGLWTALREAAVTIPLCIPVTLLFRQVARYTHAEE